MQSYSKRTETPEGFVEVGIVVHQGREYASGGAYLTDQRIVCYPAAETVSAEVRTWDGQTIGRIVKVSSRPAVFFGRPSWQASRYFYFRVRVADGREYACRGFGAGMLARGKRVK